MKQIIWSSEDRLDDNARERYQEFQREVQDDNTYIVMVFADLGLWYGRRQGYQILGSNIADILHSQCDEAEWYGDGYNIRGRMIHHDGTNYVLYRIAKDRDEAERIAAKIYSGEIDEEGFRRRTRSLYPYVADVYGWKTRNRKKSA